MASRQWHREAGFTVDAASVLDLVRDPLRLPELHPLIEDVRQMAPGSIDVVTFAVGERVPVGPFRLKNDYVVSVHDSGRSDTVRLVGRSFPAVVVDSTWVVVSTSTGSHATWDVTVTAPWLVAPFVFTTAALAHDRLLAAIRTRLDEASP